MAMPLNPETLHGDMHKFNNQKKLQDSAPHRKPHQNLAKSHPTNANTFSRADDMMSDDDDGENGDEEDNSSSSDDDEDSDLDEPDDLALSGAGSIAKSATTRLAGHMSKDTAMVDDDDEHAVAGATDDDYGEVENVSDSGEESTASVPTRKKSVLQSAEQDLISEFNEWDPTELETFEPKPIDDPKSDNLDLDLDPFVGLQGDDPLYKEFLQEAYTGYKKDFEDSLAAWRNPEPILRRENSLRSDGATKRVHFDELPTRTEIRTESDTPSRTSSVSSEEDPRATFGDLFDGMDDPFNHQVLAAAMDDDSPDTESVYDFDGEEDFSIAVLDEEDSDFDSEMSGSDYDSHDDEGDTTDEDSAEVQMARMAAIQKAAGREPPSAPSSAPSTPVPTSRPASSLGHGSMTPQPGAVLGANKMPKLGTFAHDPTRASISTDASGNGIKVVCPTKPPERDRAFWEHARSNAPTRTQSIEGQVSWTRTTSRAPGRQRPLTAKSTLGSFFDGDLSFLQENDHVGITQPVLQPSLLSRQSSLRTSFTSSSAVEMEISGAEDSDIDLTEFVNVDDSESDADADPSSIMAFTPASAASPSIASPWNLQSSPVNLSRPQSSAGFASGSTSLDHLHASRGLVSSFRNNQHHVRHVSSLPLHPAKRAEASEHNALLKGRRSAANTPMTPARKKRGSRDLAFGGVMGSPGVSKTKAGHRRGRGSSLGGMSQTLALDRFAAGALGRD